MAYPDHRQTYPANRHIFHQNKAYRHDNRHRSNNGTFGFHGHRFLVYKTFQMLFVKIRAYKPIVEPLRTFRKTKDCRHVKGNRRKDWEHHPNRPERQTE